MFYDRLYMKKSALALLSKRWDKAAFIGFFIFVPFVILYVLFLFGLVKTETENLNAGIMLLAFLALCVLFACIGFVLVFALCRWSIQLAKSAQTGLLDAPQAPTLKDFFKSISPISIGLGFYYLLKSIIWMLLVYASMIPVGLGVYFSEKTEVPALGVILIFAGIIMLYVTFAFVYAKLISFGMAFYAFAEDMTLSVKEAINLSEKVCSGFRTNLFVTKLSFFGWYILGSFTMGIAYFWIIPYYSQVMANSWLFMKAEKQALGVI